MPIVGIDPHTKRGQSAKGAKNNKISPHFGVGVDIGTSKINFVLLKNKQVFKKKRIQTPKKKSALLAVLNENIRSLGRGLKIEGIGIGAPGPLNKKGDLILSPPNLICLKNCPLAKIIGKDFKIKTRLENDVNCFTLAETLLGAAKNRQIVFGITLGTGVGGGLVIDGKIYRGAFGGAAEVGHITVKYDGSKCSCGSFGCLEEYASERFFLKKGALPQKFQEAAYRGDKKAKKIYNEYGRYLGMGLSSVVNLLDPEVIVVGGGIANAYQFFIKAARKELQKRVVSPDSRKCVKIKKAKFGDFAGAVGAALLIK